MTDTATARPSVTRGRDQGRAQGVACNATQAPRRARKLPGGGRRTVVSPCASALRGAPLRRAAARSGPAAKAAHRSPAKRGQSRLPPRRPSRPAGTREIGDRRVHAPPQLAGRPGDERRGGRVEASSGRLGPAKRACAGWEDDPRRLRTGQNARPRVGLRRGLSSGRGRLGWASKSRRRS